jgi:replicative DNA helicase
MRKPVETKNNLYDVDVERNVIGSILSYAKALDDVRGLLCVDSFFEVLHQNIYTAALNISGKGDRVDIISVTDELRRMGKADDNTPYSVTVLSTNSTPNYYHNAKILFELYSRRSIWDAAHILANKAGDLTYDLGSAVEEHKKSLSEVFSVSPSSISTVREAILGLYDSHIRQNLSETHEITGSPTGFSQFDEKSGGLHPGNLVIIAAETSQGKTSFAMSTAFNAAKHGHGVAVYSLEMGKEELMARIVSGETGIPANKLLYGRLCHDELKAFDTKAAELADLPAYFDDNSTSNIDLIFHQFAR